MKPPYLTTAEAEYLRYRTASAVRTLKMRGLLRPAGRRLGTDLYHRDDLDRFVSRGVSATIGDGRPLMLQEATWTMSWNWMDGCKLHGPLL